MAKFFAARYRPSLRVKLNMAISLAYLVVALGSLGLFFLATKAILFDFAQRIAVKQALLERNKIVAVVDRELALANTLAKDSVILRWALDESNPEAEKQGLEQLENYRRHFRDQSYFMAFAASRHYYIHNREENNGQVKRVDLSPEAPGDHWFFETMKNVDDYALNMDYNTTIQAAKVWFNVVLKDSAGRKLGIGGGGITITDFIRDIVSTKEQGVQSILVDKAGVIQAYQDQKVVELNASTRDESRKITIYALMGGAEAGRRLKQALYGLAQGKSEVESFPVDMGPGGALAAVTALPGTGWFDVVLVDVASVVSNRVFWPMLALIVTSLLVIMIIVSVLISRMVIRPLLALTKASGQMADGHYAVSLPVTRHDELGQLTNSFNRMAGQVLDYTRNLEAKVAHRTAELVQANEELNLARQHTLESLRYARAIQLSILPRQEQLAPVFREHMALYRPRDIVGGDLYYFQDFPGHCLIAVLDCTGHGVPGAFMAMTAHSVLNHVVSVICRDDPAKILRETDLVLRETMSLDKPGEGYVDCGLEMALCRCHKDTGRVDFAGAGLSLFRVRAGEVLEIKGDRRRIGYRGTFSEREFTNHSLETMAGDRFYATTDGFLDEGGERGVCFGGPRFQEMLLAQGHLPMAEQGRAFEETLARYRGDRPQRDDVTMIGFSI